MKYIGFIWKSKELGKYLILVESNTHIGHKLTTSLTYDIESATVRSRLPVEISKDYDPIRVEIIKQVKVIG